MEDEKNSGQSIDGVLEQLKKSYTEDSERSKNDALSVESASEDFSRDELQKMLRSQFIEANGKNGSADTDKSDGDGEYEIDEDFLQDAYSAEELDVSVELDNSADEPEKNIENAEELEIIDDMFEEMEKNTDFTEEENYGFHKDSNEGSQETEIEEELQEEAEAFEEISFDQGFEEIQEEDSREEYQEDQEISIYQEPEEIQEEEYFEALEEDDEAQEAQEIQEGDNQSVPISNLDNYFEDDEDYSLWSESEEQYQTITLDDDENDDEDELYANAERALDGEDEDFFFDDDEEFLDKEEASPQKSAEDNYVDVFYNTKEYDRYENMSFKEKITEDSPTVEELEQALSDARFHDEFTLEEFDEAQTIPLIIDEDNDDESDANLNEDKLCADDVELDRSDIALLLEFGYKDEVLNSVSSENIEKLSDEELINNISAESDDEEFVETPEPVFASEESENERFEKARAKIQRQYDAYRSRRGGLFLKLIITSIFAVIILLYELLPIVGLELGGIFNREEYFFLYVLAGMQLMIFAAIPALKSIYESAKRLLARGVDAYFVAGLSLCITVIYDLIVVFASGTVPPTFHLCAAFTILFAEFSELVANSSEMKNYEYYFYEYLFEDDGNDAIKKKYTLLKSEGRGSIAEKMYAGGLDAKNSVYAPNAVDSASGFFSASKKEPKRSKITLSTVVVSIVVAIMLTIVSGIMYEASWAWWIAASTFLITFNFMLPIVAVVAEWLPFECITSHNYAYGAAFASEAAAEQYSDCDMLVLKDTHLFEKCDAKSVNLAIYDSTSKAVLLSCLNSIYSEIGGPLESAFASLKLSPMGKCKINRIARSGVEAQIGSNYSVLIGDEQFMSRYGVYFPTAALAKEEDKIFTLCVSINNRPTARVAVKYKVNEQLYGFLQKLSEDKIYCVLETYDPMISSELFVRVRPYKGAPVNIVHKNATDHAQSKQKQKEGALLSATNQELLLLARGSRLNLAAAASNAKKLKKLRRLLNICSIGFVSLGGIISLLLVLSERIGSANEVFVIIYWILSLAVLAGLLIWRLPQKDRFLFKENKKR